MTKSGNKLCPVRTWAAIVKRLWSHKNTTMKTDVNIVHIPSRTGYFCVKKEHVETRLKNSVSVIGESHLGIKTNEVGCHSSIRATFATILQFSSEKETKLKNKGRWRSDAYKGYVRSNVTNNTDTIGKYLSDPKNRNFFTFQRHA